MAVVPFFATGQQGKSHTVTAQRHLNLYAEQTADKSQISFFGTPGTTLRKSFGDTPARGWIAVGDLYYLVHRGTLYSVNNAGTATTLGTLNTTSGRVDMAYDGTLILMVDGTNGYTLTLPSTFAQIGDADFPNGANTCAWLDGQFIVDDGDSDQFFISANGTAWDALDFATAESNPDGLVRVFADNGEVVLGGSSTFEFWGSSGDADFPFSAIKGATQEFGLAARWSLCKFNSGLAALVKPASGGQVQVAFFTGYVPKPISSQEVDSLINDYATVSDATFYAYMLGGHPMLQCNFPSAGKSWLYDASTGMWTPLEYGLNGARHRGEMALDYLNKTIIADYSTGDIYNLDADTYTDNGTAIAREIVSKHIFNGNARTIIDQLYVDMQVGVGLTSGQGVNPQVSLQISKNNGAKFGTELWRELGAMGAYLQRVVWRRLGVARDWLFKLRVTDPVKVVFTFGDLNGD